ncbi:MAG: chemotaxis protein CheA [Thermodesulfobacteriota bacterium]
MENEVYKTEAMELLDDLEAGLLELEDQSDNMELINRIFRALHTIKGGGKMFGFDEVTAFTHDIETTYDLVRSGRLRISQELVSLTLNASDVIRRMIQAETVEQSTKNLLLEQFHALQGKTREDQQEKRSVAKSGQTRAAGLKTIYRINFRPAREIFKSGTSIPPLLQELAAMGECTVVCHHGAVPALDQLDIEVCYLHWDIILTTDQPQESIRDVFIFVEDLCELKIIAITDPQAGADPETHRLLGEILVERGDVTQEKLLEVLRSRPLLGEQLVRQRLVEQSSVEAAVAEQRHLKNMCTEQLKVSQASSVRVAAEKLDALVDLVGELVIVQARLSQHSSSIHDAAAINIAEEVERLTTEMRDITMGLRMLPIGTTFSKFKRLVRDLSRELGKEIEMTMEGGETELDKTVIEQLNDPLVHIIRNSIDHGIELPEQRKAKGKEATGTISLQAEHAGASVLIRISDDGAGLDADAIRRKALEKGLLAPGADMSDEEVFPLIFEPGFSTAASVSDVSGRGVGMDVVKRGVETLRGSIEVSSVPDRGTAITIRLPLTLAIIDGLLVETGGERYVIPQAMVIECFEQTREDVAQAHGNNVINVRGQMLPYVCLRQRFTIAGDIPASRRVVLCEASDRQIGLAVDRVIGNHQTVIKPLGEIYKNVDCVSGATILGDGAVALIIDPLKVARVA